MKSHSIKLQSLLNGEAHSQESVGSSPDDLQLLYEHLQYWLQLLLSTDEGKDEHNDPIIIISSDIFLLSRYPKQHEANAEVYFFNQKFLVMMQERAISKASLSNADAAGSISNEELSALTKAVTDICQTFILHQPSADRMGWLECSMRQSAEQCGGLQQTIVKTRDSIDSLINTPARVRISLSPETRAAARTVRLSRIEEHCTPISSGTDDGVECPITIPFPEIMHTRVLDKEEHNQGGFLHSASLSAIGRWPEGENLTEMWRKIAALLVFNEDKFPPDKTFAVDDKGQQFVGAGEATYHDMRTMVDGSDDGTGSYFTETVNADKDTILHRFIAQNNAEAVKRLVEIMERQQWARDEAIRRHRDENSTPCEKLEVKPKLFEQKNTRDYTPMELALRFEGDNHRVLQALRPHYDLPDEEGNRLLHRLIVQNNVKGVQKLVAIMKTESQPFEKPNNEGYTPIQLALKHLKHDGAIVQEILPYCDLTQPTRPSVEGVHSIIIALLYGYIKQEIITRYAHVICPIIEKLLVKYCKALLKAESARDPVEEASRTTPVALSGAAVPLLDSTVGHTQGEAVREETTSPSPGKEEWDKIVQVFNAITSTKELGALVKKTKALTPRQVKQLISINRQMTSLSSQRAKEYVGEAHEHGICYFLMAEPPDIIAAINYLSNLKAKDLTDSNTKGKVTHDCKEQNYNEPFFAVQELARQFVATRKKNMVAFKLGEEDVTGRCSTEERRLRASSFGQGLIERKIRILSNIRTAEQFNPELEPCVQVGTDSIRTLCEPRTGFGCVSNPPKLIGAKSAVGSLCAVTTHKLAASFLEASSSGLVGEVAPHQVKIGIEPNN